LVDIEKYEIRDKKLKSEKKRQFHFLEMEQTLKMEVISLDADIVSFSLKITLFIADN